MSLRAIAPDLAEEMSRRNNVRINLRGNTSALPSGSNSAMPREKRQKMTHDCLTTWASTPRPIEKKKPEASATAGSGAVLKAVETRNTLMPQEFALSFAVADGGQRGGC